MVVQSMEFPVLRGEDLVACETFCFRLAQSFNSFDGSEEFSVELLTIQFNVIRYVIEIFLSRLLYVNLLRRNGRNTRNDDVWCNNILEIYLINNQVESLQLFAYVIVQLIGNKS